MLQPFTLSLAVIVSIVGILPSQACNPIIPKREPTIAEMVAGLDVVFAGMVVGYVKENGTKLMGSVPPQCTNDDGDYDWFSESAIPACQAYRDVKAALFRVDVAIVGPKGEELVPEYMSWGSADCGPDFQIGEKWLLAGRYQRYLQAPLRQSEIDLLRRLAAHPKFDFDQFYR